MKKTIKIVLFCLVLYSCNNKKSLFPEFQTQEKIKAEYIFSSAIVSPLFFVIQANYLCTYTLNKDTIIDLFSLPSLSHEKSFGVRGQGPDEFQSFPWPCVSTNDDFYVRGYTPLIIRQFSINSSFDLMPMNEYKLQQQESFGPMYVCQDSLLIYTSMGFQDEREEQISIKKINLNQNKETGRIIIPTSSPENASLDPNRAGGFAANDSFIIYAYLFKKQIDIYDIKTMKLIHRLTNDHNQQAKVHRNFEENVLHYSGVVAGNNYFYALYNEKGRKMNETASASQTIQVFDYDGNAIKEYSFDDYVSLFVVDELEQTVYAYDKTKEDYILKFDLP